MNVRATAISGSHPSIATRVEETKFKPYSNFSHEFTFAAVISNLLKLIANQFINLGNFLNQKFVKIENPSTSDRHVSAVATSALPAARQSSPPVSPVVSRTKPATAAPARAQKKDSIKNALKNHLSDVLRTKGVPHHFGIKEGDPIIKDPTTFMLPSILDEIQKSIIEGAWKKMEQFKKQKKPTETFKTEIKALIASSFYKEDYEIFLNPDDQVKLNNLDKLAKYSGYTSSAIVFAFNYFSGDMLSPSYLESVMEEIGGPYLGYAAALALWGVTLKHMITHMGIKKPSMDQVKKFMQKLVKNPSSTLAQNLLAPSALQIVFTGVAGYLDRYYGCVKRVVASDGINNFFRSRLENKLLSSASDEQKNRLKQKAADGALEANKNISRATFGWGVLSFGTSLIYSASSVAAGALNTLGGVFSGDEVNTILASNITNKTI